MYNNEYINKIKSMRRSGKTDNEIVHFLRIEAKKLERSHNNWMEKNGANYEMNNKYPGYYEDIENVRIAIASVEGFDFSKSTVFNQTKHRVAWAVIDDVNNLLHIKSKPMLKQGVRYAILNSDNKDFCEKLRMALETNDKESIKKALDSVNNLDNLISSKKDLIDKSSIKQEQTYEER